MATLTAAMLSLKVRRAAKWLTTAGMVATGAALVAQPRPRDAQCQQTTVAILGAGVAGVTTAQALANASLHDFIIIEYNGEIGGRAHHTDFGKKSDGSPYVIELGANWIQGLGAEDGPENPIWTLAKRYNLSNTYSNYSSILTYNETGFVDYTALFDEYETAYDIAQDTAGAMLEDNIQDQTMRTGLAVAGWRPKVTDMAAQATEWWEWDFEDACPPEQSSFIFGTAGYNLTFDQFGDANNFVFDPRGFNTIVKGEASTFLQPNDTRLRLNTVVSNISYTDDGVTIYNTDGSCVSAAYAVCTFSLGVLQSGTIAFQPELPPWKQTAIQNFQMATYTKIFLQFNETFWPDDTQYFLYASPTTRGYYPVFQSLSLTGFLPESNIIFVTVVQEQAYRVERQTDEQTKDEVLQVLRQMFPDVNIPEPVAFLYPRWSTVPWAYGSYSNWPSSTTLEMHQNLRANVGRLWFAGEAISAQYFGFLHGAWFTGRDVGERIAGLVGETCAAEPKPAACGNERHYEVLHGTTTLEEYSAFNGWPISSL